MIKARGVTKDGKTLLLLGLSDVNIKRLQLGEPIVVKGAELDLDIEVAIFAGRTEASMLKSIQALKIPMPRIEEP